MTGARLIRYSLFTIHHALCTMHYSTIHYSLFSIHPLPAHDTDVLVEASHKRHLNMNSNLMLPEP